MFKIHVQTSKCIQKHSLTDAAYCPMHPAEGFFAILSYPVHPSSRKTLPANTNKFLRNGCARQQSFLEKACNISSRHRPSSVWSTRVVTCHKTLPRNFKQKTKLLRMFPTTKAIQHVCIDQHINGVYSHFRVLCRRKWKLFESFHLVLTTR